MPIENLENAEFKECASCAEKTGSPELCPTCLHNRALVRELQIARRNAESATALNEADRRAGVVPAVDEKILRRLGQITLQSTPVSIPMSAIMPQRIFAVLSEKLQSGHSIHCFSCAELDEFAGFMTDEERETLQRLFVYGSHAIGYVEILGLGKPNAILERDARVLAMVDVENAIVDAIEVEADVYQSFDWPPVNAGLERLETLARNRVGKA